MLADEIIVVLKKLKSYYDIMPKADIPELTLSSLECDTFRDRFSLIMRKLSLDFELFSILKDEEVGAGQLN